MPGGLEKHVRVSEALKESGLAVSTPVPALDGRVVVQEYHLYDAVCTWVIPEMQKEGILFVSFVKEYRQKFGEIYEELPKQMIHRNMNLSYVYMENEALYGITDFELSGYSIRLFDPCYAATGILSENFQDQEEHIRKWIALYREILKGYDSVVYLTDTEK